MIFYIRLFSISYSFTIFEMYNEQYNRVNVWRLSMNVMMHHRTSTQLEKLTLYLPTLFPLLYFLYSISPTLYPLLYISYSFSPTTYCIREALYMSTQQRTENRGKILFGRHQTCKCSKMSLSTFTDCK